MYIKVELLRELSRKGTWVNENYNHDIDMWNDYEEDKLFVSHQELMVGSNHVYTTYHIFFCLKI